MGIKEPYSLQFVLIGWPWRRIATVQMFDRDELYREAERGCVG